MSEQIRCEPLEAIAREMIGAPDLPVNLVIVTQDGNVVAVIVENHEDALKNAMSYARGLSGIVLVEKTDYGIYWENEASQQLQDRLGAEEGELCLQCRSMQVGDEGPPVDGQQNVRCQECGHRWTIKAADRERNEGRGSHRARVQ